MVYGTQRTNIHTVSLNLCYLRLAFHSDNENGQFMTSTDINLELFVNRSGEPVREMTLSVGKYFQGFSR